MYRASFAALAVAAALLEPSTALAHAHATRLTSYPPAAATAGSSATIAGRLTSGGRGLRGEQVALYWIPAATGAPKKLKSARTSKGGRYTFKLTFSGGSGDVAVRFAGNRHYRSASSLHLVTVTTPPAPTTPTPNPTPVAPVPTPTPSAPTLPPDPTTVTTYAMEQAPEGITPGSEACNFGSIGRTPPAINAPTGTRVYAINKLFDTPTGYNQWRVDQSSDLYYNGTARPVFDWYDIVTNQLSSALYEMTSWNMKSGWTASIVQYVWDDGVWYVSVGSPCAF